MSPRKRRTFTTEQKAQAVRLSQELGSIAQVARDLDLTESSLSNWIRQAKIDEGGGQSGDLTTDERAELRRLRRENRILEQERSFPKTIWDAALPVGEKLGSSTLAGSREARPLAYWWSTPSKNVVRGTVRT